jgi:hypothetical protein
MDSPLDSNARLKLFWMNPLTTLILYHYRNRLANDMPRFDKWDKMALQKDRNAFVFQIIARFNGGYFVFFWMCDDPAQQK